MKILSGDAPGVGRAGLRDGGIEDWRTGGGLEEWVFFFVFSALVS